MFTPDETANANAVLMHLFDRMFRGRALGYNVEIGLGVGFHPGLKAWAVILTTDDNPIPLMGNVALALAKLVEEFEKTFVDRGFDAEAVKFLADGLRVAHADIQGYIAKGTTYEEVVAATKDDPVITLDTGPAAPGKSVPANTPIH